MDCHLSHAYALYPGVNSESDIAFLEAGHLDPAAPISYPKTLPMMLNRRLSEGARLALEVATHLQNTDSPIEAMIFSSRHAEAPRAEGLYSQLGKNEKLSPTDFMMSVHNAAVGMYAIHAKSTMPASSIAAGADSFHSAIQEALGFLHEGKRAVMIVDFESRLPSALKANLPSQHFDAPYAVGLVLEAGSNLRITPRFESRQEEVTIPASLAWWRAWNTKQTSFETLGERQTFQWERL